MIWPDYVILTIILLSVLVGGLRGFIKEVFALAIWFAAFLVAFQFSAPLADWLTPTVTLPSARTAMAFAGLFIAVLLVGALLTFLVGKLVEKTGLTGTDRLLGAIFGAVRGLVLIVMIILVAGFTPMPRDPWWGASPLVQAAIPYAEMAADFLPESVNKYLNFHPDDEGSIQTT